MAIDTTCKRRGTYDVVRVVREVSAERVDSSMGEARRPRSGDVGAILGVHVVPAHVEPAYIVECLDATGRMLWVADLLHSERELVQPGGAGTAA